MANSSVSLRLLGAFQLLARDQIVDLGSPRSEELVALLAVNAGEALARSRIASLLWPESGESQARNNTRTLLHRLRQSWPAMDEAIDVDSTRLIWRERSDSSVDAVRFVQLSRQADAAQTAGQRIDLLKEAASLYRGDFLVDCYADWALAQRERLRSMYAALLDQLVDTLSEEREVQESIMWARTLQRFDPLRESSYRRLMLAHAAAGDRASALRAYHTCATTLEQELGVSPSAATEEIHHRVVRSRGVAQKPRAPQAVSRQRMVGRRSEWQELLEAWRTAQQGSAQCVLLWGEAGMGKTRLAEELISWARHQGFAHASSRCYAIQGALTYAPVAEWLRAPEIRPTLDEIEELWRVDLGRLLPELSAERPDLPQPGPMTETWQQQRFYQSIVHALQAAPAPLLLHMDDLQWSDAETLTLLHFLLHSGRNHPLLLVGGIRSEDAGANQALAEFVEATRHAGQLRELRLEPLTEEESSSLIEQTAGRAVEPALAKELYATGQGHPLFLTEAVRSGWAEPESAVGEADQPAPGRNAIAGMPPRIYSLLAARLDQLSPAAQQVASMAAVVGRAFDHTILAAATAMDEAALIDALDELWRRRIIREQAEDSYDFSHDRIREVAYQELSRPRRHHYHRQVAAALESIYCDNLDPISGELAGHFAVAGDSLQAYGYYRRAATIALENHAFPNAARYLEAALGHAPDDPAERIGLLLEQDITLRHALQFARWRQNLDEEEAYLALMQPPDLRSRLDHELSLSKYCMETHQGDLALGAAQRALALAEEMQDVPTILRAYETLCDVYWRQNKMTEARRESARMAEYARNTGDMVAEGKALGFLSQAGMFSGMATQELLDLVERSLAVAEQTNNRLDMANLHNKLGYIRLRSGMGQHAQIERDFRRAYDLGHETGSLVQESIALTTLGQHYALRGDYRMAVEMLRESEKLEREQPVLWRNWVTLGYAGGLQLHMGCLQSALNKLGEAADALDEAGYHHYEVNARCDLGLAYHLAGDDERAISELTRVLELLAGYGDLRFEALASTRLAYALESTGAAHEARLRYQRGFDLHRQMAQHYYAMNALAGLARLSAAAGELAAANGHAEVIWDTIGGKETDATIETARTLRTCYTLFSAQDDPRSEGAYAMAWDQLQRRASTIDDEDDLAQFWRIEDHAFFRSIDATR